MGFLDKAKEAAGAAATKAHQLAQAEQAKLSAYQQTANQNDPQTTMLYSQLGQAYYREQRHGGDPQAVAMALKAVEQHVRGNQFGQGGFGQGGQGGFGQQDQFGQGGFGQGGQGGFGQQDQFGQGGQQSGGFGQGGF